MTEEVDVEARGGADERDESKDVDTQAVTRDPRRPGIQIALIVGAVSVVAIAGLVGWLGYCAYQSHQTQHQRELFLRVGRQAALDFTTISHTEVDADVQHILDSSTGTFHEDFQQQAQPFIDLVKRDRAQTEGTITESGLQSITSDSARVLVAVSTKTTTAGAREPHLNRFRMRIDITRIAGAAKVSNVEFVG